MNKLIEKIKKICLISAAISLLSVITLPAIATGIVPLESTLKVANVTAGDTTYKESVNAKVDEVVKFEVWYHNPELSNSGKIAQDVTVKVALPTEKRTNLVTTSTVKGTNTNTVADTANVFTQIPASLAYIPGSAKWRHNTGTITNQNWVTEPISDNIVTSGVNLGDIFPCWEYQGTVTILARVMASAVSINKYVRVKGEAEWKTENSASAGDTLEYQIRFKNEGNTTLNNVVIGDNLPGNVSYIADSTWLKNGANPNGIHITSNNITTGGIDVGNYLPGAVGYVKFEAQISPDLSEGCHKLVNVGIVRPEGMGEYYNTAITNVCVTVPQELFKITIYKFNDTNINGVRDAGEGLLSGWQFNVSGVGTVVTGANGKVTIGNLEPGTYHIAEITQPGWTNTTADNIDITIGPSKEVWFGNIEAVIPPPPTPPPPVVTGKGFLPQAGAVEVAIPFITTLLGGAGYWYKRSKKELIESLLNR